MSPLVRAKLERNAAYHAQMAEHYADLYKSEDGEDASAKPGEPTPEQATELAETHAGAAKELNDLLAADPPQAALSARAITRQTGPVRLDRGSVRMRMH
jgi:hypothetical protein